MAVQDAQAEATLHDETLSELGLTEQPFLEDKKRQRFADASTQRSRAALEQHLRFGDSLHLLIGEDDAGKTVLLSQLIKHCKSTIKPFVVKGSADFEAEAFLAAVLHQLDSEEEAHSVGEHIEKLSPLLAQITNDQYSVVLVVDDAHLAPLEEIAELVDITQQFENEDGKTARLLLTGRPSLKQAITKIEDQFEDLQLTYSTNLVPPFDEERVREYLSSRLQQAGHADAFPFTDKAITKIQRDSAGLPGKINTSATHYLNGVYRGGAAAQESKGGLFGFEWPVLVVGAAALGAIGWGLSMFFGNSGDDNVPNTDIVQIEAPVSGEMALADATITDSVVDPVTSAVDTGEQDSLLLPANENQTIAAVTDEVLPQVADNTEATTIVANQSATDLIASPEQTPSVETPPVATQIVENTAPTMPEQPLVMESVAPAVEEVIPTVTVPRLATNEDIASNKSVSNDIITDNVPKSVAVDVGQLAQQDNTVVDDSQQNIGAAIGVIVDTGGDTDAASLDTTEIFSAGDNKQGGIDSEGVGITMPEPNRAIENERWVLFQSPTKFTVQLATSRERGYIIDLAQTLEVIDPVAIYPFLTTNSQNPVYGLLSGLYDTRSEAIAAVEGMSSSAKKFGTWIRPVSDLQDAIKNRR